MKKKLLAVTMSLAMVASLAGCAASEAAPAASAPAATEEAAPAEAAPAEDTADAGAESTGAKQTDGKNLPELTKDDMTILLWDIATEEPNRPTQEAAVARFMKDYPNIHVEQVHQQKDRRAEQHKREIIIFALALAII